MRQYEVDDRTINRIACSIVALLPENDETSIRVLDLARQIMTVTHGSITAEKCAPHNQSNITKLSNFPIAIRL